MTDKAIIFDASTLITFSMNGLWSEFRALKESFKGHFIITNEVKSEIIDRPIKTKKFELEALKLQKLFNDKILELPEDLGVRGEEVTKKSKELLDIANSTFQASSGNIKLIDMGETSCLTLSKILDQKNIKNVIAVDERTIRMLGEKPENLKNLFQKKLKTRITPNPKNYDKFQGFKFIRSAELVYIAYKDRKSVV